MKISILFLICFNFCLSFSTNEIQYITEPVTDYKAIFEEDYKIAEQKIKTLQTQFSKQFPTNSLIAQSIIFPELIRYSLFRDILETESLKLIYIEEGSEMIDFSIGTFQMKPSFIEKIEKYLQNHTSITQNNAHFSAITTFNSADIHKIRKQRIERIQRTDWQILYLSAFMAICYERFENLATLSQNEQVIFLAAAYNTGFDKLEIQINKSAQRKIFPYGTAFGENQHAYTQISLFYFLSKN